MNMRSVADMKKTAKTDVTRRVQVHSRKRMLWQPIGKYGDPIENSAQVRVTKHVRFLRREKDDNDICTAINKRSTVHLRITTEKRGHRTKRSGFRKLKRNVAMNRKAMSRKVFTEIDRVRAEIANIRDEYNMLRSLNSKNAGSKSTNQCRVVIDAREENAKDTVNEILKREIMAQENVVVDSGTGYMVRSAADEVSRDLLSWVEANKEE